MNYTQYLQAIKTLNLWAKHYYILDDPIASDEEYDTLHHQIKEFEAKNPNQIAKDTHTQSVGGNILESFSKSGHIELMWRL